MKISEKEASFIVRKYLILMVKKSYLRARGLKGRCIRIEF